MLALSFNSIAQTNKIEGEWIEKKSVLLDTIVDGFNEILKDYDAYKNGEKKLDAKFIIIKDFTPKAGDNLKLEITKEKDFFWAESRTFFNQKIMYDTKNKTYYTNFRGSYLVVKYDNENKKLRFTNPESSTPYYEFERKK